MEPTITKQSGPSSTTYQIVGHPVAVRAAVDQIMRDYSPDGYGTMAKYNETGAVVTRSNSAD